MKRLRIGTRGSALALWQAQHVRARLADLGVEAELVVIKTSGDQFQTSQLAAIGLKGVFIKELEEALLGQRVDLAVHSMKDVPTEIPDGLVLAAICQREDVRDALVSRNGAGLRTLPDGARIGTSSLRRQAQLLWFRRDLRVVPLRGNVDTRLRKLSAGEVEAIVLAKAGLDRLGASDRITEVLPPEISLPAVGQGALGIECRADDRPVCELLAALDHPETRAAITAERALLSALQGGCQVPVGAWGRVQEGRLVLDAAVLASDGSACIRQQAADQPANAVALGRRLAQTLLESGADRLLQLAGREFRSRS
ncbi:MAG: hydroxymethylbilane synthase [Firmicutes bacterium]|nr:hydroxymethylbilane synthase [Bacillota bacterium]